MAGLVIPAKLTLNDAELKKGLSDAQKTVLKFSVAVEAIGASMAAAAIYTAQWQDATVKASRAAGVQVETFSALSVAAEKSNVSQEELTKSLSKLNALSPEMSKNLASIGISTRGSNGQLKDTSTLLGDVAERMSKYQNPVNQARIATKVFGEEGGKLVNLLKDGKAGLAAASAEAEKYGLIVTEKAAAAAEKFNDDMTDTKNALKGLTSALGESIIAWTNQGGIMDVVRNTIAGVTQWWRGLDADTKNIIVTIGAVVIGLSGLVTAMIAVQAAAPLVGKALTVMFGPVGLLIIGVVTAISAVVYAVMRFGSQITEVFKPLEGTWNTIKEAFSTIGDSLKNMTTDVGGVGAKFDEAGDGAARAAKPISYFGTAVKTIFAGLSTILNAVVTACNSIGTAISNSIDQVKLSFEVTKAYVTGNVAEAQRLSQVYKDNIKKDAEEQSLIWKKFSDDTEKMFSNLKVYAKDPIIPNIKPPKKKPIEDEARQTLTAIGFDITQMQTQVVNGITLGYTKFENSILTIADRTKKVVDELSGYIGGISAAMKSVSDVMVASTKYNAQVAQRDLEVQTIRSKKAYEEMRATAETEETAKTAALAKQYDDQINALKDAEAEKTAAIEFESKQRLLLNDTEYQTAKQQAEDAHAAFMEAERARFEQEKALMDEKTYDKEQRRLNDGVMDANWAEYVKAQDQALQDQLSNLAKNSADKKTKIESDSKLKIQGITDSNAEKLKALEAAKAAALQKQEEDKNKRLADIDAARTLQEKEEEKRRLQIQYDAEVQEFEQTKAVKITDVIVAGMTGAANAFAALAPIAFPFGAVLGAAAAATIMGATMASVGQINSQRPVKPAGLIAETGGLVDGPRHSQGGVDLNAEGGELILSRGRTKALFDQMDSGNLGGGVNVYIESGAISALGLEGNDVAQKIGDMIAMHVGGEVRRLGIAGA